MCLLSWLAAKGGLAGRAEELAFRPDAPTGHYQRHLDVVTEMSSQCEDAYMAEVPSYDAAHNGRFKLSMLFLPLHECLDQELEQADANSIRDRVF